MVLVDIDWTLGIITLIGISFIQGIGYAIATWFFNRRLEKHFNTIEERLKEKMVNKE